jgi:hypothetical protein
MKNPSLGPLVCLFAVSGCNAVVDPAPVDGGVFDVTSAGEVIVPISAKLPVSGAVLFAATVEAPGGVVVSKRERIVVTAAPARAG